MADLTVSSAVDTFMQAADAAAMVTALGSSVVTLTGTQELTNKTLTTTVGKGTWTASGTWTLPAVTFNAQVSFPVGAANTPSVKIGTHGGWYDDGTGISYTNGTDEGWRFTVGSITQITGAGNTGALNFLFSNGIQCNAANNIEIYSGSGDLRIYTGYSTLNVPLVLGVAAGAGTGAATTNAKTVKLVSAIADNTATAVLTVTIPNTANAACVRVTLLGRAGAGGAVGADEAAACITYDFAIARTAGVNAVVTASTAYGSATSSVASGTVLAVTAAASAVSGAVGVSNTFTVNVTIAHTLGASTNHTCTLTYEVINANASGITAA